MKVRHLVSFTHVYYLTVDYDKSGGGVDPPILKFRGGGGSWLWGMLWTLKMVYRVPTRFLLIQLQPINHFFNSLTNEKGVSNRKV